MEELHSVCKRRLEIEDFHRRLEIEEFHSFCTRR